VKNFRLFLLALVVLFFSINNTLHAKDLKNTIDLKNKINNVKASDHKEIIKIKDNGLFPKEVTINGIDGSIFFYNDTPNSLVSLAVDWGKHKVHCASLNLKLSENGYIETIRPIEPGDFAIICFPDKGTYNFKVSGTNFKEFTGQVKVENSVPSNKHKD
jgi:hypothetical protein